jgi:hypothetical protein
MSDYPGPVTTGNFRTATAEEVEHHLNVEEIPRAFWVRTGPDSKRVDFLVVPNEENENG